MQTMRVKARSSFYDGTGKTVAEGTVFEVPLPVGFELMSAGKVERLDPAPAPQAPAPAPAAPPAAPAPSGPAAK